MASISVHGIRAVARYSEEGPANVAVGRQFDLIWGGSLFTHLDRERWPESLGFFTDRLAPDGVLAFTTHGRQPIQWMRDNFFDYGLSRDEQEAMIAGYVTDGFGFVLPAMATPPTDRSPGSTGGPGIKTFFHVPA